MTTNTTPAVDEAADEDFTIEQSVKIYLKRNPENTQWIVDSPTVDSYPLDSDGEVTSDLDREHWTADQQAAIEAAAVACLPTAEELTLMLLAALPKDSRVRTALTEITDAASNWANELTEYIAPASEEVRDHESAESQARTAEDITAAIALLSFTAGHAR